MRALNQNGGPQISGDFRNGKEPNDSDDSLDTREVPVELESPAVSSVWMDELRFRRALREEMRAALREENISARSGCSVGVSFPPHPPADRSGTLAAIPARSLAVASTATPSGLVGHRLNTAGTSETLSSNGESGRLKSPRLRWSWTQQKADLGLMSSPVRRAFYSHLGGALEWFMNLEEPPRTGKLPRFVLSRGFELLCAAVIILNAFFTLHATNYEIQSLGSEMPRAVHVGEICFLIFYIVEMTLKLIVHQLYYFCNQNMKWNIFDFMLVFVSLFDQIIGGLANITIMRTLRMLKIAKVLRVFRLMKFLTELRLMLNSMLGSMPSFTWSMVMMFLIFFMFATVFVQGTAAFLVESGDDVDPTTRDRLLEYFGSVQAAMLTMFMATTAGDDWAVFYDPLSHTGTLYSIFYLFFVAFTHIALLNIMSGIFIERALKLAQPDRDRLALEHRKSQLRCVAELTAICKELDFDGNMRIDREQWSRMMMDPKLRSYFSVQGLDIKDAEGFFRLLLEISGEEEVEIDAFVDGCMKMRGGATSLDMQTLAFETRILRKHQKDCFSKLMRMIGRLEALEKAMAAKFDASEFTL